MRYKLVDNKTGRDIRVGDTVRTFRGERAIVKSVQEPHSEFGHGGRVYTNLGGHYASVYDLKWMPA